MDTLATHSSGIDVVSPFPVRRFTVEEYRRLGEIGVLTENERVELLEGWIIRIKASELLP